MVLVELTTFCGLLAAAAASHLSGFEDGHDLAFYVTRPELRPPLWNVTIYQPDKITPGYWLVAPYADFAGPPARPEYQPCQAGPTIYDGFGNLVWSGACLFNNRNTFDFKGTSYNGSSYFSFVEGRAPEGVQNNKGFAVVLNDSYVEVQKVADRTDKWEINLHEFNIIEDGKTALIVVTQDQSRSMKDLTGNEEQKINIHHDTFRDIELATGKTNFAWYPLDHGLSMAEVAIRKPKHPDINGGYWDFLHINSVDKNSDGDYLVSARYANAIYKVSGKDGSIMWRLGGLKSDFNMDFTFSSQHHARFVRHNETVTILSFLDNASDDHHRQEDTSEYSTAKIVALYTAERPMRAKVVRQLNRPDGALSRKRGNVEVLPNKHILICWSDKGYMSEHSADGELLFEARFKSPRFSTYRAYKFNFTGNPTEPPVLKTFSLNRNSGITTNEDMSISYVSWNGATEVKSWNFYGSSSATGPFELAGSAQKTGFETRFVTSFSHMFTYVEAIGADSKILGQSSVEKTISSEDDKDSSESTVGTFPVLPSDSHSEGTEIISLTRRELGLGAFGVALLVLVVQALAGFSYMCWTKWLKPSHQYQSLARAEI